MRIIGADEAAEALGRDDVAHRRRRDEPRYGDRPERAGRPTAPARRSASRCPPTSSSAGGRAAARPAPRAGDDTAMPHWTEPPTGEVPRIFAAEDLDDDDDSTLVGASRAASPAGAARAPTATTTTSTTSPGSPTTRPGSAPWPTTTAPDPEDFFAFDEDDALDDEPVPAAVGGAGELGRRRGRPRRAAVGPQHPVHLAPTPGGPRQGRGYERPPTPAATCRWRSASASASPSWPSLRSPPAPSSPSRSSPSCSAVAAVELFNVLRQAGYQPATCSASPPCVALPLAAYYKGEAGIPVVLFLTVVFGLLWYLAGAGGDDRPVIGLSSRCSASGRSACSARSPR